MSYTVVTDNDRELGELNTGDFREIRRAIDLFGGPVLKQFVKEGGTGSLEVAKQEFADLLKNDKVDQPTKMLIYQFLNMVRKAGSFVMVGM